MNLGRSADKLPQCAAQEDIEEETSMEHDQRDLETQMLVLKLEKAFVQGKPAKTLLKHSRPALMGLCSMYGLTSNTEVKTKKQLVDLLIAAVCYSWLRFVDRGS